MVKLVNTPLQLEPFLKEFKDLFTSPSYNSFCDMSSALSVCDKSKTVSHLSRVSSHGKSVFRFTEAKIRSKKDSTS